MTLVLVMQKASKFFQEAAALGTDKFLLDGRDVYARLSTLEIYSLPTVLEPLGLKRDAKVAVVYSQGTPPAHDFEFMETVAINRGFNVRLFTTFAQATEWLRQGKLNCISRLDNDLTNS